MQRWGRWLLIVLGAGSTFAQELAPIEPVIPLEEASGSEVGQPEARAAEDEIARLRDELARAQERIETLLRSIERLRHENATQRVLLLQRDGEISDLRRSLETRAAWAPRNPVSTEGTASRVKELEDLLLEADRRAAYWEKQARVAMRREGNAEEPAPNSREEREVAAEEPGRRSAEVLLGTLANPGGAVSWAIGEGGPPLEPMAEEPPRPDARREAEPEPGFEHVASSGAAFTEGELEAAAHAYAEGRLQEAARRVEAVLRREPNHPRALGLKGLIAWQEGDLVGARRWLERAVARAPGDARLHNDLGIVYHAAGERRRAIRAFRRAVALDPSHAAAQFNLCAALASLDRPPLDEARTCYEAALRLGGAPDPVLERLLYP